MSILNVVVLPVVLGFWLSKQRIWELHLRPWCRVVVQLAQQKLWGLNVWDQSVGRFLKSKHIKTTSPYKHAWRVPLSANYVS